MNTRGTSEVNAGAGIPGWVEPPGTAGYRLAQQRQLKQVVLGILLVLLLLLALGWPFVWHAIADLRTYQISQNEIFQRR